MNFNFIITEKCNWECSYCFFPRIENQKHPKLKNLQKHIPYIKDIPIDGYMDVQGGEIGLVPIDILEYFFTTMKQKMYISTNGLFLTKKMHLNEKIRPYIEMIQWHVHPEPCNNIHIYDIHDKEIFISKGIVGSSMDNMINFLNYNKHIMFHYIDFEYYRNDLVFHDADKYRSLYAKINHIENLTEDAKQRIRKRVTESKDLRSKCMFHNDSILIDLVNENICLCQRNLDVNVNLTEKKLLERIETEPIDFFNLDMISCYSCGRLYEGKTRRL